MAGSHLVIGTNHRTVGAACAATEPVRTVVTTVMGAEADAAELKKKRRKAARTLLGSGQSGPSVFIRPRKKHLVDGELVSKLPFNANGVTETTGLFGDKYGNPYSATSRQPAVIAETVVAEPAIDNKQTWCEWVFSCSCRRRN